MGVCFRCQSVVLYFSAQQYRGERIAAITILQIIKFQHEPELTFK